MTPSTLKKTVLLLGTAFAAASVHASGYHFGTQSVNAQSTANAAAAEAADASTIFYNPAGLTKLDSSQISVNANIVLQIPPPTLPVFPSKVRKAAKSPKPRLRPTSTAHTKPPTT